MPDLPEEAVEAAAERRYEAQQGFPGPMGPQWKDLYLLGESTRRRRQSYLLDARRDLQAAAPAIRKQEQGQIVTRLLARNLLTVEIEEAIRGPLEDSDA